MMRRQNRRIGQFEYLMTIPGEVDPDKIDAMLDNGVHLPPLAYEAWFVGAAHDDRALDRIATAVKLAAYAAADVRATT